MKRQDKNLNSAMQKMHQRESRWPNNATTLGSAHDDEPAATSLQSQASQTREKF
jgi:hypothetical protein